MSPSIDTPPVLVIGAGPAGLSAVQWLQTYGIAFDWVSRGGHVGGMLEHVANPLPNYPGRQYENGAELAEDLRQQVREAAYAPPADATVSRLERRNERWQATFEDREPAAYRAVVVATGTRYRDLGVPGEREGRGDYVSQSTSRDADRFGGRTVAVVGGGDAGFEGALQLARAGSHVHLLLRSEEFKARPQFVEPVREHPHIFIQPIPSRVECIEALPDPRGCRVHVDVQGRPTALEVACVFVRVGVDPVLPAVHPAPEIDDAGYLVVDRRQRTSVDGLFAAGDITDPPLPAVATAVGAGADAAVSVASFLGES